MKSKIEIADANKMFDALSQETRLLAFRHLVKAGHKGLPAGMLSDALETPHNTMSFHLSHLVNSGLVTSRREGRSVIYTAQFEAVHMLIDFLVQDCCSEEFATIKSDTNTGQAVITLSDCCQ